VEASAGLRPATPDNTPFVGWTAMPGVLAAVGHYRSGILLAPLTASRIADLVDHHAGVASTITLARA
jgi:glycine oxidase